MHMTSKAELIEVKLGRSLDDFVSTARRDGRGWREIAADLTTRTGVRVSHESLRYWARKPDGEPANT